MEGSVIKGIWDTRQVFINGVELLPAASLKLKNHSPDGFAWGYGGSGPAQLALAILLRFCTKEIALSFHQQFKWVVIAALPSGDFELPVEAVKNWIENNVEGEE